MSLKQKPYGASKRTAFKLNTKDLLSSLTTTCSILLMNGTDRIDQTLSTVKCHRKSYIWPKKLGLHLTQRVGVVNGFVLAKKYFPVEMRHKSLCDYELLLIEALFKLANKPDPRRPNMRIQHELEKIPSTERRPRPSLSLCFVQKKSSTRRTPERVTISLQSVREQTSSSFGKLLQTVP